MSFQVMAEAVKLKLPASKKCLMMMLANYADDKYECWPSYERLAEDAGMGKRTVINYLAEFEEKGLVSIKKRTDKNQRSVTNLYRLNVESWVFPKRRKKSNKANNSGVQEMHPSKEKLPTEETKGRVQELHPEGAGVAPYEGAGDAPNTINTLSLDTITGSVAKATAASSLAETQKLSQMNNFERADFWIEKMDGSKKWAFDCALSLIGPLVPESETRAFIAGAIKKFGLPVVSDSLLQCVIEQPFAPKDYLAGIFNRHKKRTLIGLDWQPSPKQIQALRDKGLDDENIKWARAVFLMWFRERELMHHDWPAAFDNWCERELIYLAHQKHIDLKHLAEKAGFDYNPVDAAMPDGMEC